MYYGHYGRHDIFEDEIKEHGLQEYIKDAENLHFVPIRYRAELLLLAKEEEQNGDFKTAMQIYDTIVRRMGTDQIARFNKKYGRQDGKQTSIYYQARFAYYVCKIKSGEQLTAEDAREMEELAAEDKENVLKLVNRENLTAEDIVALILSDSHISFEEFEKLLKTNLREERGEGGTSEGGKDRRYIEALSVKRRIEKYKEMFHLEGSEVGITRDKLRGPIVFYPTDKEGKSMGIVFVDTFFDKDGNEQYGESATIMHNTTKLELTSVDRKDIKKLREIKKENKGRLLFHINHIHETFYDRIELRAAEILENHEKNNSTLEHNLKDNILEDLFRK